MLKKFLDFTSPILFDFPYISKALCEIFSLQLPSIPSQTQSVAICKILVLLLFVILFKVCGNIELIVNQLLQLSSRLQELEAPSPKLNEFLINWHFSVTQKYELEKILRRWSLVLPNKDPFKIVNDKWKISKDVILALRNELKDAPMDATSL